jgi:hypothetical protein
MFEQSDNFPAGADPHISQTLNMQIAAGDPDAKKYIEDQIGAKFDFSGPDEARDAREPPELQNHRPFNTRSEAEPQSDAEQLEAGLERLFGGDEPEPPTEKPQREVPREPPKTESVPRDYSKPRDEEPAWTAAEFNRVIQARDAWEQLNQLYAANAREIANLANVHPDKRAAREWELGQQKLALERNAALILDEANALEKVRQDRRAKATEQYYRDEKNAFFAKLPGTDIAQTFEHSTKALGFSEPEFCSIPDHRYLVPLEESRRYRELTKLYPELMRKHYPGEHSQQQKPQRAIRKVTKIERSRDESEQSRNDSATLQRAARLRLYDNDKTKAALDRRLSRMFR